MISRFIAISTAAAILSTAPIAGADQTFKARMSGDQEVPPVTDQGTSGKFEIQFNRDFTEGEYKLVINSGVRVTQAHLHCAPAGVNGPVIIFLAGIEPAGPGTRTPAGYDVDGQWISNATITDANIRDNTCGSTLAEVAKNAALGKVYVNAHSVAKPGGVARGQLESN
jgi:hypothetical protein